MQDNSESRNVTVKMYRVPDPRYSGLLRENVVREILQTPEEYIDSSDFFSCERYFTKLLIKQTEGTYLKYKKCQ